MSIQSVEIIPVEVSDLLDSYSNLETNLDVLRNINKETVIPTDVVTKLVKNIQSSVKAYPEISEEILNFSENLSSFSPTQISSILYDSGIDEIDFDTFSFDIESIDKIKKSFDLFSTIENGGSDLITSSIQQITDLSKTSLDGADLTELANTITYAVTTSTEGVLEAASKSSKNLANDILNSALEVESSLDDLINVSNELENINISTISSLIDQKADSVLQEISNRTELLTSSLPTQLSSIVDLAQDSFSNQKLISNNIIDSMNTILETSNTKLDGISSVNIDKSVEYIKQDLDFIIKKTSKINEQFFKTQAAAFTAKFKENNPDASDEEIRNVVQTQVIAASKAHDADISKRRDCLLNKTRKVEANLRDITAASNRRESDSAAAGRVIAKRSDVLEKSNEKFDGVIFQPNNFSLSRYKSNISSKLMEVHPKLRKRYAFAIIDYLNEMKSKDYDIRITSAHRTIEKQRQLYRELKPKGMAVAFPGNSWHNYRVAIDIACFYKGKYITKGGFYLNVARPYFEKYGLHNPFRNDRIHFQPKEVISSPRTIRAKLTNSRTGSDDPSSVATLLDSPNNFFV